MQRRSFLKSAAAASSLLTLRGFAKTGIPRRVYRERVELSIIGFGGIVVVGQEQESANRMVAEAIDRGVNYFDVAPAYGDGEAEIKLGNALVPHRKGIFLACKTGRRDAAGARTELERSLQRLHTDHVDLYQFHAVSTLQEVNTILGPGGAAETFLKARDEGKVRFLGTSAHSIEAAFALLDRFTLDSILFPVNFVCFAQGNFGPQVVAHAKEKGVARLALKAMAYTKWSKEGERKYAKCWYKPVDDRELARQALRFTLSRNVTAAVPPGDERLFRVALDYAPEFQPMTTSEQQELLATTKGVEPIFHA